MFRNIFKVCMIVSFLVVFAQVAIAEDYSIKKMTPEVTVALENRRARYSQLAELKQKGIVGENKDGYVSVLEHNLDAVSVVEMENKDRKVIYQTIASQNNLGKAIQVVEQVFANVQRGKAKKGEQVQLENGKWTTK